jgi:hypothetical protein
MADKQTIYSKHHINIAIPNSTGIIGAVVKHNHNLISNRVTKDELCGIDKKNKIIQAIVITLVIVLGQIDIIKLIKEIL